MFHFKAHMTIGEMLYIYIASLILPSAFCMTIKVKGSVELGNQVATVFKELREHFLTQIKGTRDNTYSFPLLQTEDGLPVPIDFPFLDNIPLMERTPGKNVRLVDRVDVPLLEEIVRNKKQQVHVYGNHNKVKRDRPDQPLNDIVV